MNPGLGEVVGLLLAWPFVALTDWFTWIKRQPPGQQELTKACHGVGMLALLAYWFWFTGGLGEFVDTLRLHPDSPVNWIPVVMAAWGLGWFLLNARFAGQFVGPQRATMIVRALIKIALAYAVWVYAGDAGWAGSWVVLALRGVAVWGLATGATKLLLMMWGGARGQAYSMVARDIADGEFDWDQ